MSTYINILSLDVLDNIDPIITLIASVNVDIVCLRNISEKNFKHLLSILKYFKGNIAGDNAILIRIGKFDTIIYDNNRTILNGTISIWCSKEDILDRATSNVEIIAGNFVFKNSNFIDVLRSVGNFEPKYPYNSCDKEHIIIGKGIIPISADILDYGIWKYKDEQKRVRILTDKIGTDCFPIICTVKV